jgi:hypothetical protein
VDSKAFCDGVRRLGLLGFWTPSIVRYSEEHSDSKTNSVSETMSCFKITGDGQILKTQSFRMIKAMGAYFQNFYFERAKNRHFCGVKTLVIEEGLIHSLMKLSPS